VVTMVWPSRSSSPCSRVAVARQRKGVTDVPTWMNPRLTLRPTFIPMTVRSDRSPARQSEEHRTTIVATSGTDRTGHVGGPV
jgi:hypothetical protein